MPDFGASTIAGAMSFHTALPFGCRARDSARLSQGRGGSACPSGSDPPTRASPARAVAVNRPYLQQIELRLLRLRKDLRRFFSFCFGVNDRAVRVLQMGKNVFGAIQDFVLQAGQSRHLNPIALIRTARH